MRSLLTLALFSLSGSLGAQTLEQIAKQEFYQVFATYEGEKVVLKKCTSKEMTKCEDKQVVFDSKEDFMQQAMHQLVQKGTFQPTVSRDIMSVRRLKKKDAIDTALKKLNLQAQQYLPKFRAIFDKADRLGVPGESLEEYKELQKEYSVIEDKINKVLVHFVYDHNELENKIALNSLLNTVKGFSQFIDSHEMTPLHYRDALKYLYQDGKKDLTGMVLLQDPSRSVIKLLNERCQINKFVNKSDGYTYYTIFNKGKVSMVLSYNNGYYFLENDQDGSETIGAILSGTYVEKISDEQLKRELLKTPSHSCFPINFTEVTGVLPKSAFTQTIKDSQLREAIKEVQNDSTTNSASGSQQ